jgi:hypothetical protein
MSLPRSRLVLVFPAGEPRLHLASVGQSEEEMGTARADPPRVSPPFKPNQIESLVSIW